ncbi:MAG: alpha/beta hydrolase [Desulfatiglandales bacterium]
MAIVYPVIIVPGITAVNLADEYPLPPEIVWRVLDRKYERIALHPNDLRYEALQPARLRPGQVFDVPYRELVEELRYNLRSREDEPVPVYPFSYDWRMPLKDIEPLLDAFVGEVIRRTSLLRHYHKEGFGDDPKVNFVGHSMGGLVITGYLERKGTKAPVHKVATLATPYQGSFEAVIQVATGTASLGSSPPSSREREAARMTPALYHLLPGFKNALQPDPGIPDTLFDPAAWQPSVLDSIEQFIRLKGLPTKQHKGDARALFAHLLRAGRTHRERINRFTLAKAGLRVEDWLAIVGVDAVTRVRLKIIKRGGRVDFDLASKDRENRWRQGKNSLLRRLTGDGTVPFEGAVPTFLKEENLVCVTPDDYGYWEIQDKGLSRLAGFHGILPNMNMLHRILVRFFTGRSDPRGNTWGRRAPGAERWNPPMEMRERDTG